jgi:adenosylmethionine-8-amino-7-oxononanoate aminotransferase
MSHNIQPLLNKKYLKAKAAQGIFITDENGKQYLDGSSGAITCSVGHSHPKVIEAIRQQAGKLQFVYRSQFGSEEAEKLATKLYSISPGGAYAHTFFVNSGTEAIETAMKVALQYFLERGQPKKTHFVSRWKSYHGITMGALSLSGHPLRRQRFETSLQKFPGLSADLERDAVEKHEQEFLALIERIGAENIAAFVAEPIVGAAGTALTPGHDYYQRMKSICRKHDILFIADEVMTGLGRTGQWFGLDHWRESADIVAVGKSLGAGYAPIAATMMTESVLEPIKNGTGLIMSGHTYSGHPLSCAAALRVLEVVEEEKLLDNVNVHGDYLKTNLLAIQKQFPVIQHVRGKGLMLGVEFNAAQKGFQVKLIDRCFENGLLVYPSVGGPEGKDENGTLIAPPFIITRSECDILLEKLVKSIEECMNHS